MKKLIILAISLFLALSFCSCSNSGKSGKSITVSKVLLTLTPEDTVKAFFSATQNYNLTLMRNLSISETSSNGTSSTDNSSFLQPLYKKISYKIIGNAQITGNTAIVNMQITTPDTKAIMGKNFNSELTKSNVATITSTINIQLTKQSGPWKINFTSSLADAISGGFYTYEKSVSNASNGNSK
jgi:hypothetical protein